MQNDSEEFIKLSRSILVQFKQLEDPRVQGRTRYQLIDIVFICLCGILCNQNDFEAMEEFAKNKIEWFRTFIELPNGVPSHDTLRRVLSIIDPNKLEKIFIEWVKEHQELIKNQVIAMDGKLISGTGLNWGLGKEYKKRPLALVNVWASKNKISLGQFATKSTGSPEVNTIINDCLENLNIKNMIITVDAANSTPCFAQKVIKKGGDYLMPIKNNQKAHSKEIRRMLSQSAVKSKQCTIVEEKDRKETRVCTVFNFDKNISLFQSHLIHRESFPYLRNIVHVKYTREEKRRSFMKREKNSNGEWIIKHDSTQSMTKTSVFERYFLTSIDSRDPKFILQKTKDHWTIENSLHWQLDVLFSEDDNRVREHQTARNMSSLRKLALNLLSNAKEHDPKMKLTRIKTKCTFNDDFREKVIFNLF